MSLELIEQADLKRLNTFALPAKAALLLNAHSLEEIREALALARQRQLKLQVLGGGSNVLLTADLPYAVLRPCLAGRRLLEESAQGVLVEGAAGESWHDFVQWTLAQGLQGLENLSLIPGTVGAAPVQNIGAYGVELKDRLHSLTALDVSTGQLHEFTVQQCAFDYRDSRFKREAGRWLITAVRLQLTRNGPLQLDYGPLRAQLAADGVSEPSALAVSRAVCAIRRAKLPDPAVLGNAGSFFKNPVVPEQQAQALQARFPHLVSYPAGAGQRKLAAGWLIEQAGLKGYRQGDAAVHSQQALVLVNQGNASGAQIMALAQHIQAEINQCFGVQLEIEPVQLP